MHFVHSERFGLCVFFVEIIHLIYFNHQQQNGILFLQLKRVKSHENDLDPHEQHIFDGTSNAINILQQRKKTEESSYTLYVFSQ